MLPVAPERLGAGEHPPLALEQPVVLRLEDREDELLLAAEVVVDLAERDARRLGDGPRREVGVALGEEARPGGGEDRGAGLGGRLVATLGARDRVRPVSDPRPAEHTTPPVTRRPRRPRRGSGRRPSGRLRRRPHGRFFSMAVSAAERRASREARQPDAEHHEHQRPAAADAERAVGDAHRERLAPLGRAAPAVDDEAERAPALVEAAVAERAELPQARRSRASSR